MLFALGTTSTPKINGINQALQSYACLQWQDVKIRGFKVSSGVPDMPLTLADLRLWAKNRTEEVRRLCPEADFFVGMEWGVYQDSVGDEYWLTGLVYIENSQGEGHYGYSCHMPVPEKIVAALHDGSGRDLEQIMEDWGATHGIGDAQGCFGLWSADMLTRTDQFRFATQCAIVPFFNEYYSL